MIRRMHACVCVCVLVCACVVELPRRLLGLTGDIHGGVREVDLDPASYGVGAGGKWVVLDKSRWG